MASGGVTDTSSATIDEAMLRQIMEDLDADGDGEVSKEEFKVPWMKLFPKLTPEQFDKVWDEIDEDGDGNLSYEELAKYYGFNLSPSSKRSGGGGAAEMTDEQILEALQLSATLEEMQREKEDRKKAKEAAEKAEAEAAEEAKRGLNKRGSRLRSVSGGSGSDGLRRASIHAPPQGQDREKKKTSSGIETVKMPTKVTFDNSDPDVNFMQLCELGDEKGIEEALKNKDQRIRIEDDKGEMPMHKLARMGCLEAIRDLMDKLQKTESVKIDLNWQDKQGKTPIFYAIEFGHSKLVQLLLDRGSEIMIENNNGWTILHTAVNSDRHEICQVILSHPRVVKQKRRLVDATDKSERTALHIASFKSKEGDMVTLLLRNGADASAQDASGNTGMKLAEKTGRRKSKELLEEHMHAALAHAKLGISAVNAFKVPEKKS